MIAVSVRHGFGPRINNAKLEPGGVAPLCRHLQRVVTGIPIEVQEWNAGVSLIRTQEVVRQSLRNLLRRVQTRSQEPGTKWQIVQLTLLAYVPSERAYVGNVQDSPESDASLYSQARIVDPYGNVTAVQRVTKTGRSKGPRDIAICG